MRTVQRADLSEVMNAVGTDVYRRIEAAFKEKEGGTLHLSPRLFFSTKNAPDVSFYPTELGHRFMLIYPRDQEAFMQCFLNYMEDGGITSFEVEIPWSTLYPKLMRVVLKQEVISVAAVSHKETVLPRELNFRLL